MDIKQITGVILAGGRGSRMGGADKGLQPFRGVPMALHVVTRLAPQVGNLMINANRNISSYKEIFGVPVWPDERQDFAGPLAGVQTALRHCKTEYLVTVPCDSPFLPIDLAMCLGNAMEAQNADLAVAVTRESGARQPHPVFGLLKKSLLPHLTIFMQHGGRKVDDWHALLQAIEVDFPDTAAFLNINTMEDLQ